MEEDTKTVLLGRPPREHSTQENGGSRGNRGDRSGDATDSGGPPKTTLKTTRGRGKKTQLIVLRDDDGEDVR